jgi:hypothetical protein
MSNANFQKSSAEDPLIIVQFYHSHTFRYLIEKWEQEIRRQIKFVPEELRQLELAPALATLGETSGDSAWQVFRDYLDKIESAIAKTVRGHSPSFWFHLHRRIRPMLRQVWRP